MVSVRGGGGGKGSGWHETFRSKISFFLFFYFSETVPAAIVKF